MRGARLRIHGSFTSRPRRCLCNAQLRSSVPLSVWKSFIPYGTTVSNACNSTSTAAAKLSGGDHWPEWPPKAITFLKEFLHLQNPPNFQLVADELETRLGFKRCRESVAAFARTHFPKLIG